MLDKLETNLRKSKIDKRLSKSVEDDILKNYNNSLVQNITRVKNKIKERKINLNFRKIIILVLSLMI
jgi:hypothetical protein